MRVYFSRRNETPQSFEQGLVDWFESLGHEVTSVFAGSGDLGAVPWSQYDLLVLGVAGDGVTYSSHPQAAILSSLPVNILTLNGADVAPGALAMNVSSNEIITALRDRFILLHTEDPRSLPGISTVRWGNPTDGYFQEDVWTFSGVSDNTLTKYGAEYGTTWQYFAPGIAEQVTDAGWKRVFLGFPFFESLGQMPELSQLYENFVNGLAPFWGTEIEWRHKATQEVVRLATNWAYDEFRIDGLDPEEEYEVRIRSTISQQDTQYSVWWGEWSPWTLFDVNGVVGYELDATEVGEDTSNIEIEVDPQLPVSLNIDVTEIGEDTVNIQLTFDPVSFEVRWREASVEPLKGEGDTADYFYVMQDLELGTAYEWSVRVFLSEAWKSEWSGWELFSTTLDPDARFVQLDATEVGEDTSGIELWVEPPWVLDATEEGEDTATVNITVEPAVFDFRWREVGQTETADETTNYYYDITGLNLGTNYEWSVRARYNELNVSDWTDWQPFTTLAEPPNTPVNIDLVPGQATGAGRELQVAAIVNVEAQAGQAAAAGRTLVPDVQVSIPASATIEAGQAVSAGRVLATTVGVAAEVNTVRGEAVAAGRFLGPQGAIAETLQPGVGAAAGHTLTPAAGVSVDLQSPQATAAGGQLSAIAGATATIAPAPASAAGLPVGEKVGVAQGLSPGQATSSGHTLQGEAGAAVEALADLQPGAGTTAGRTLTASVGRVSSLIAGASLAQGRTLGGAAGQTTPLTAGQAIGGAIALAPLAGARVSLIAPQTAAGAGRALEPFAGGSGVVSLIAGQGAGNGRWLSLSAGAQVELVSGAALSQGRSLEPQVTGSADVDLLRGAATAQGRNLQSEVGAVVGAEADLQKGIAEGAGRTLSPAAGMIIDLSRGFSEAGGRLLSPQAGVSVPATVALLTGQATAAGRALQLDSGVGVNETVQPGHANVLGKQLSFQAGHNILFVAGAAVGAGKPIEGTSTHLLGRCKDPDSISGSITFDSETLTTKYESTSATQILDTARG